MSISADYIKKMIDRIKNNIEKSIELGKYEDALSLIMICANILYQTNVYYVDDELENVIGKLACELKLNNYSSREEFCAEDDFILFFDGFGLNDRGLIQIYLKALCKVKKVVYVTYEDRKTQIPDVQDILFQYNCEKRYINRKNKNIIKQITMLNDVVKEFRPRRMFFYSTPDDVVATPILFAYKEFMIRYQINLTDHAFWLGARCIDKCIEFRNYGANISNANRKIDKDKIVIIPFYPILHREKKFQGFPFYKRDDQKVIFSGGALYKTLGGGNKYYEIVDKILENHSDTIFWYAGSGDDSQIKKILAKYPERAFLTAERSDLSQILEHCNVYLSTYPMCGGLMLQYAAVTGKVPVTLKNGNISDEFLINQENIDVEFDDINDLYEEIDKLLTNDVYAKYRSELMKKSVIAPDIFDEEVRNLIEGNGKTSFLVSFEQIDTKGFKDWYLDCLTESDVDVMFVRKNAIKSCIMHYPLRFFGGVFYLMKRVVIKR